MGYGGADHKDYLYLRLREEYQKQVSLGCQWWILGFECLMWVGSRVQVGDPQNYAMFYEEFVSSK